jgi:hypothetical protein
MTISNCFSFCEKLGGNLDQICTELARSPEAYTTLFCCIPSYRQDLQSTRGHNLSPDRFLRFMHLPPRSHTRIALWLKRLSLIYARSVNARFALVVSAALACSSLPAQSAPQWKSCPVISKLPADLNWTEPLDHRQRFELRQCGGDRVIVTAYEKQTTTPGLVFDTGDGYPRYLMHALNVLVFQSIGGASDHVYVFVFRSGKPAVALKTATKELIQVKQLGKAIIVVVPPITYPGPDGKFPRQPPLKEYSFPLEY